MTEKLNFQLNLAAETRQCIVFMSMPHKYPTHIVMQIMSCVDMESFKSDCWMMRIDQIQVNFCHWQMLQAIGGIFHQVRKPIGPELICASQQHWGWKLAKSSTWHLRWGQTCEKIEMQGFSKIWANHAGLHFLMEIVLLKVTEMLG